MTTKEGYNLYVSKITVSKAIIETVIKEKVFKYIVYENRSGELEQLDCHFFAVESHKQFMQEDDIPLKARIREDKNSQYNYDWYLENVLIKNRNSYNFLSKTSQRR
ncbi:hypothetical protein KHQ81_02240 [Mycoplasmatota bacterium]|nr:hypothetical protein KHQ81_02240 [Mycoplasmatota bacterium]